MPNRTSCCTQTLNSNTPLAYDGIINLYQWFSLRFCLILLINSGAHLFHCIFHSHFFGFFFSFFSFPFFSFLCITFDSTEPEQHKIDTIEWLTLLKNRQTDATDSV